ncbi:putative pot1-acetyl-c-peroxisomal [Sesbania bispinosa]|nr:putative pot1-acetyl-c-peroxisomal [Sesbania bispinosa]
MLPDIVSIEAIDENVTAEVQEVYSGSSHRHLRSSVSTSKFYDEERQQKKIDQNGGFAADLWLWGGAEQRNVVDGEKRNKMRNVFNKTPLRVSGFCTPPTATNPTPFQHCTLLARASLMSALKSPIYILAHPNSFQLITLG